MLGLFFIWLSFLCVVFLPNPPPPYLFLSLLCQRPFSNVWWFLVLLGLLLKSEVLKSWPEALRAWGNWARLFPCGTHNVSVFMSFLLGWSDFLGKDLLISFLEDTHLDGSIPFTQWDVGVRRVHDSQSNLLNPPASSVINLLSTSPSGFQCTYLFHPIEKTFVYW